MNNTLINFINVAPVVLVDQCHRNGEVMYGPSGKPMSVILRWSVGPICVEETETNLKIYNPTAMPNDPEKDGWEKLPFGTAHESYKTGLSARLNGVDLVKFKFTTNETLQKHTGPLVHETTRFGKKNNFGISLLNPQEQLVYMSWQVMR